MSKLFDTLKMGPYTLKNRIIMAPLTRARAGSSRIPNEIMLKHYRQRASAGLILTEATAIDPKAVGYANTPGIWSKEQIAGWKKITEAVHAEKGLIFTQLWHVGRISDPMFLDGDTPVAPSAIQPKGHVSLVRPEKAYVVPRALATAEVKEIVTKYKMAAKNAMEAGFDGVEIHAANGYLIDQFLQDGTNHRTDEYGGSLENRTRFLMEIVDACIEIWGADRVGVHLSPRGDSQDMHDSNPEALFTYVTQQLSLKKIAFIFTREYLGPDSLAQKMRSLFNGVFIVNEKYTQEMAENILSQNAADAVAFGLPFISNPDLVRRFMEKLPLNQTNFNTLYAEGELGYNDYPTI